VLLACKTMPNIHCILNIKVKFTHLYHKIVA
jgi:hypothetical protein